LEKIKIAILDGSMLSREFGGHFPITKTIKSLKLLKNLKAVYFTHNGHTKIPHQELEKKIQELGGKKFKIAYDGMEIGI